MCTHLILQITFAALITDGAIQWVIDLQMAQALSEVRSVVGGMPKSSVCRQFDETAAQVSPCCPSGITNPADHPHSLREYVRCPHQQKLHDSFPRLLHKWRVCLDVHAWGCRHCARGNRLWTPLYLQADFEQGDDKV